MLEKVKEQQDTASENAARFRSQRELEQRNKELQEKAAQLSAELQKAHSLIAEQQATIGNLYAELYQYHVQVIQQQHKQIQELSG